MSKIVIRALRSIMMHGRWGHGLHYHRSNFSPFYPYLHCTSKAQYIFNNKSTVCEHTCIMHNKYLSNESWFGLPDLMAVRKKRKGKLEDLMKTNEVITNTVL